MSADLFPEREILTLLRNEQVKQGDTIEGMREMLTDHGSRIQGIEQTLHGPKDSNNGLYRAVKKIEGEVTDIKTELSGLVKRAKEEAKAEREEAEKLEKEKAVKIYRKTRIIVALIGLGSVVIGKLIEYLIF